MEYAETRRANEIPADRSRLVRTNEREHGGLNTLLCENILHFELIVQASVSAEALFFTTLPQLL